MAGERHGRGMLCVNRPLVYSAPIENKEAVKPRILSPLQQLAAAPGPLEVCESPQSCVSVLGLIQMEHIFSICSEF